MSAEGSRYYEGYKIEMTNRVEPGSAMRKSQVPESQLDDSYRANDLQGPIGQIMVQVSHSP